MILFINMHSAFTVVPNSSEALRVPLQERTNFQGPYEATVAARATAKGAFRAKQMALIRARRMAFIRAAQNKAKKVARQSARQVARQVVYALMKDAQEPETADMDAGNALRDAICDSNYVVIRHFMRVR